MQFEPENMVVKFCVWGIEQEMAGNPEQARMLFLKAWEKAETDKEKCTAAHYLARQQETVAEKLKWDETALEMALKVDTEEIKAAYPSLYLNLGKCHEDLGQLQKARENYTLAQSFTDFLHEDGYGNMIRAGIEAGFERVREMETGIE